MHKMPAILTRNSLNDDGASETLTRASMRKTQNYFVKYQPLNQQDSGNEEKKKFVAFEVDGEGIGNISSSFIESPTSLINPNSNHQYITRFAKTVTNP